MNRRRFLEGAAGSVAAAGLSSAAHSVAGSPASIELFLNEPEGTISPDLYGYLLENVGTAIYDAVWVGPDSSIPNSGGIRQELIDRLRAINASVIRWPGGNFADSYDWRDGVGPRAARPRRTNVYSNDMPASASGAQRFDPNQFGTPEFLRLCQLSGGRPLLSANVRSLPAEAFNRWMEYCNAPAGSTTLADLRRQDGSVAPYGIRYWGIGNEVWAAGGNLTATEYATLYKRFTASVTNYDLDLAFIASGGPPPTIDNTWVKTLLRACKQALIPVPIDAMSLHYYATNPLEDLSPGETIEQLESRDPNWLKSLPDAVAFGPAEWYDVLARSAKMDAVIQSCWKALEEFDPKRRIKLAVDEWGIICKAGTELSQLDIQGRAVTLRDALAAAITLDSFNRHANKLLLACIGSLVNQNSSLFRAEGPNFVATPIYQVFKLYAAHQGGQAVRASFESSPIAYEREDGSRPLAGLSGSASVRGQILTLTVVNPHVSAPTESRIELRGGKAFEGTAITLTNSDIRAQNTFADSERVKPLSGPFKAAGSSFRYTFPAASVTRLSVRL